MSALSTVLAALAILFGGQIGSGGSTPGELASGVVAPSSEGESGNGCVGVPPAYKHGSLSTVHQGDGPLAYTIYEPREPAPVEAPVVVFLHGWISLDPGLYGHWIQHLVRSGHVVIYPRYQDGFLTSPDDFLNNAVEAVRDGLDVLQTAPERVRPDLTRLAVIGHSAGGNMAVYLAAAAEKLGLPPFKAVVSIMPGEVRPLPGPGPSALSAGTRLTIVAGDQDRIVGDAHARHLFSQALMVLPENKLFVLYRSDSEGPERLLADHFAPFGLLASLETGEGPLRSIQKSQAVLNRLDRQGLWLTADLTLQAAFTGITLAKATQKGSLIENLGGWPSGRPVRTPIASNDLEDVPRVVLRGGLRILDWSRLAPGGQDQQKPPADKPDLP